ncbi:hypothetical protein BTJ68_03204 [Hortaea werneckii EXF-2000]|uniref:Uncharacterized protein n=1 Tax=Hortaea werneckii EXF-2000 TaxID=1157616 RepID=A0A1Z5TH95_HORWE|nr:hypothetical protein BTJ68_03204 [Hortaea werneckii EXF-2000]
MTSFIPDLTHQNISYYFLPMAWVIAFMPRIYAANTYNAATNKHLDQRAPRQWSQTVAQEAALDAKTKGRITRAEAAQANGFENLGLFAAAITAGNSSAWLVSRFVYNHIYIFNDVVPPAARGITYMFGVGMCMMMFVLAGQNLSSGSV